MPIMFVPTVAMVAAAPPPACSTAHALTLSGVVHDSDLALIPGATLSVNKGAPTTSGSDGRFRLPCLAPGALPLTVTAEGFAPLTVTVSLPHRGDLALTLQPASVQTNVEVTADDAPIPDANSTGAAQTISGKQLQSLADDPDDLQRELQQLAAASGGSPSNTTISVNGFQDSSKLPPKSSIAYIKVNPDLFSAEYREPPFGGGRVEVYTKPGQSTFHGALFGTNGSPFMNARDPFSTSKAALGKQRYGFELTGPLRKGADFALDLEHRSIDNFGVVNAVGLDSNGNATNIAYNVPTPQRLWVGEARVDLQLGPRNTFITTYSANVNSLRNVGVGGTVLEESGYDAGESEHVLRFVNITTATPHIMNEARLSLQFDNLTYAPQSTAPQVQVAGAFTGGGAAVGFQHSPLLLIEADDDAIITTGKHTLKFGFETHLNHHGNDQQTLNFNGTYQFGGGTAPVLAANGNPVGTQTTTISGLEQYRRSLLHLPGGTPTAFSSVTGNPALSFSQVRAALFVQDEWDVGKGVHIASGLRYFLQSDPLTFAAVTPRLGVLWSPSKKGTWTLHAHTGLFAGQYNGRDWTEISREDGTARVTRIVYNPAYCGAGAPAGCDPYAGLTPIQSYRTANPHLRTGSYAIENIGGTRLLPFGFNLSLDYYFGRIWNSERTLNINSPLNGSPTGPRPLMPNVNILQVQNSGQGRANVIFAGIEQHTLKRVQFFFGGVRVRQVDDTDDNTFFQPQSAYSNAGEFSFRSNQPVWNLFGNASFTLPEKIVLSGDFDGGGDAHFNLVTGFDNNGDGDFNDRPQIAAPGTAGAVNTRYGLLVATGGTGVLRRNLGVMPWTFHLDTNIQRAFTLARNAKAEHQQTLTVNLRSANVLNHTNVTAVGGVFNSPLFDVPYQADNGRRVEAGVRYSF